MIRGAEMAFMPKPDMLALGGHAVNHLGTLPVLGDTPSLVQTLQQDFKDILIRGGEVAGGVLGLSVLAYIGYRLFHGVRETGAKRDRDWRNLHR